MTPDRDRLCWSTQNREPPDHRNGAGRPEIEPDTTCCCEKNREMQDPAAAKR